MMQAGILELMGLRESEWCCRAFPVLKYNPEKSLYLVLEGASKIRTVFYLLQRINETDPTKGVLIINAGSSLLPTTKDAFSPVKAEAISLDRACTSCHHWLYYTQEINLISYC